MNGEKSLLVKPRAVGVCELINPRSCDDVACLALVEGTEHVVQLLKRFGGEVVGEIVEVEKGRQVWIQEATESGLQTLVCKEP